VKSGIAHHEARDAAAQHAAPEIPCPEEVSLVRGHARRDGWDGADAASGEDAAALLEVGLG
jgi:hypothetical protein